jgi:ABC-2 type transport system permease protein
MIQAPAELFMGVREGPAGIAGVLGVQLAWLCVLLLLGRRMLGAATRKVVVQGG